MAKLNGSALGELLQRVHLKGLIQECVLTVSDGVATVQAIDMSNSIFLHCSQKVGGEDMELGFNNLSTLTKYLDDSGEVEFKIGDKWLTIKRKGQGQLKFLLLEITQVPTAVKEPDAVKKIKKMEGNAIPITDELRERFAYYFGLVKNKSVVFSITKKKVYIRSNRNDPEQFQFAVGKTKAGDMEVEVYSEHLLSILDHANGKKSSLHLAEETPVVVHYNKTNLWALTPIAGK